MKKDSEKKQDKHKKKKKKKRSWISTLILVLLLLAGVGIMAYPTVSDWWNSMHATRAIASYVEAVEAMTQEEKDAILDAARAYNEKLSPGVNFSLTDEEMAEYESLLDLTGTGIMGYIRIPSINVNLPVYHTVEESVLQIAVGHIPGSSLPVGGETCHTVMSGHRGLPSARLFTDLDKISEGDIFSVTVLDEEFTYMVDQVRIVEPEDTTELGIVRGKDRCTLVTCTPYGVNTHRMLVRGCRIDTPEGPIEVRQDGVKLPTYIVAPAIAIPMLFILLLVLMIFYRRRPKQVTLEDIRSLGEETQDDDSSNEE